MTSRVVLRGGFLSLALALASASTGCARPPPRAPETSQAEWTQARRLLGELRRKAPHGSFVETVRVSLHEPRSGRTLQARGAVAVDPHRAMRLVLLGPGGTTALDVWVSRDAWRFAVPSLNVVRRSTDTDSPADADRAAGFPIGFFRWWFLEPLEGRMLTAYDLPLDAEERQFARKLSYLVLREGDSTVALKVADTPRGRLYFATRRETGSTSVDHLSWASRVFAPEPGLGAHYKQSGTGIEVDIEVEDISAERPDPTAFLDPDHGGASL